MIESNRRQRELQDGSGQRHSTATGADATAAVPVEVMVAPISASPDSELAEVAT